MPGRKLKFQEKTKVISFRVPESKAKKLKNVIQEFIDKKTQKEEDQSK